MIIETEEDKEEIKMDGLWNILWIAIIIYGIYKFGSWAYKFIINIPLPVWIVSIILVGIFSVKR